jgi:hypothetical protein
MGLIGAIAASIRIASERTGVGDYSWTDRSTSIVAAMKLEVDSFAMSAFGAGRGSGTIYFSEGKIPLTGYQFTNTLADIASVLFRLIFEMGFVFASILLVAVMWGLLKFAAVGGQLILGLLAIACWLAVIGLTITYESSEWIWAFPGLFLGLHVLQSKGNSQRERLST